MLLLLIYQILQLFTGLEEWDLLGRDFNAGAGLGIAAHARLPLTGAEASKAADLDLVAGAQRAHHAVEDGFHHHFAVFTGEFCHARYFFDQVSFCHDGLIYLTSTKNRILGGFPSTWCCWGCNPKRRRTSGRTTSAAAFPDARSWARPRYRPPSRSHAPRYRSRRSHRSSSAL